MPEKWTGDLVGKMHVHSIKNVELAQAIGITEAYVSMVLKGSRKPVGARRRFEKAVAAIIANKKKSVTSKERSEIDGVPKKNGSL